MCRKTMRGCTHASALAAAVNSFSLSNRTSPRIAVPPRPADDADGTVTPAVALTAEATITRKMKRSGTVSTTVHDAHHDVVHRAAVYPRWRHTKPSVPARCAPRSSPPQRDPRALGTGARNVITPAVVGRPGGPPETSERPDCPSSWGSPTSQRSPVGTGRNDGSSVGDEHGQDAHERQPEQRRRKSDSPGPDRQLGPAPAQSSTSCHRNSRLLASQRDGLRREGSSETCQDMTLPLMKRMRGSTRP